MKIPRGIGCAPPSRGNRLAFTRWDLLQAASARGESPGRNVRGGMAMKNQISVGSWGRKHWVFASGTFVLLACLIATAHEALRPSSPARQAQTVPITRAATLASYGKLPLVFEKNLGQTSPQVKFLAHASGYALFLTGHEAVLRLDVPEPETTANSAAAAIKHRAGRGAKDRNVAVVSLS